MTSRITIKPILLLLVAVCLLFVRVECAPSKLQRRALADDVANAKTAIESLVQTMNRVLDGLAGGQAAGNGGQNNGNNGNGGQKQGGNNGNNGNGQQGGNNGNNGGQQKQGNGTAQTPPPTAPPAGGNGTAPGAGEVGNVRDALTKAGVIPDVISDFNPTVAMKITFPTKEVNLGNNITPAEAKTQPKVDYTAQNNDLFTLIMTDPDVPSRAQAKNGQFRHWTFVNIQGNQVAAGQEASKYVGPGPPPGSGPHRYTFLLFKQPKQLDVAAIGINNQNRAGFKAAEFAKQQGLELVGANFMLSENP